ncbi:MAG: hypothetical protein ACKOAD_02575 [Gammaproteobacteria bacterium]
MSSSTNSLKQEQIQTLEGISAELAGIYGSDVDIHTHTRTLGDRCRKFIAIDQAHSISGFESANLETVIRDILAICPEDKKGNVTTVLKSIRDGSPDGETRICTKELLLRTWSMIRKPGMYGNAVDVLISNLSHNIEAGGGCMAGIAGRLILPYTAFVLQCLKNTHTQPKAQSENQFEEDLARAMSASEAEANTKYASASAAAFSASESTDSSESALQRALRLSREAYLKNKSEEELLAEALSESELAASAEREKKTKAEAEAEAINASSAAAETPLQRAIRESRQGYILNQYAASADHDNDLNAAILESVLEASKGHAP